MSYIRYRPVLRGEHMLGKVKIFKEARIVQIEIFLTLTLKTTVYYEQHSMILRGGYKDDSLQICSNNI